MNGPQAFQWGGRPRASFGLGPVAMLTESLPFPGRRAPKPARDRYELVQRLRAIFPMGIPVIGMAALLAGSPMPVRASLVAAVAVPMRMIL